jgi:beta-propeller repeat-containing protein/all-beta uncharacterized protein
MLFITSSGPRERFLVLLVACLPLAAAGNPYGKLPLSFETNQGQTDARVKFLARASGYTLFMTADEAVFAGRDGPVERMKLIGANRKAHVELLDKQPGISNYFIGNDPSKWRTNVPNYRRMALREVYPGIDLIFYGNERQLEYDWVVSPGADPKRIHVKWEGPSQLTKNASGDLVLNASLVQRKPVILQEGKRVEGGYVVRGREVSFELAKYDAAKPLVIDPVLVYSTFLGGNEDDYGSGIAVDGLGNAYIAGSTASSDFPTDNVIQARCVSCRSGYDVFVTKINAAGSALMYSTFLGGSGDDSGNRIALDGLGNVYVTGSTESTNFPTATPLQAGKGGGIGDAFVTKINAEGSALVYSTYLGGSGDDSGFSIAVDSSGNAYVTGYTRSTDFPTANPLQDANGGAFGDFFDAFVTKINAAGSALVYSTYLGGNGRDSGFGIAVDSSGNAYVTGVTESTNFPTANSIQASNGGGYDAFVTKINAAGSALVYSTYLGGNGNEGGAGIAVDASRNTYVTGSTSSTNFLTANSIQASNGGGGDAFVTKINAAGSALAYSTYLGGSRNDSGSSIAVDGSGNAYVTGFTESTNFPTTNPVQAGNGGGRSDAFVTRISAAGSALAYSTYLGGSGEDFGASIAVDGSGNAYLTGSTSSANFPLADPIQTNYCCYDAFVLSISAPSPFAAGGQSLSATGGNGSLNLALPAGDAWTAASSESWLTLTGPASGTGSGTLSFQVAANAGPARSATITVAGSSFTIEQQAGSTPGLGFIGSMPHIAAEANWTTTFTLVNKSPTSAQARLNLLGDSGGTLMLPLTFPQLLPAAPPLLAESLDRTLAADASLIIATAGPQTPPVQVGSAQLAATNNVDGFAIFHNVLTAQEAVVPLETRGASSYLLAFDNTNGVALGVALQNISAQAANIPVVIRDDTGAQIGAAGATISLAGNGHTSFVLSDPVPGFAVTANKRGTIEFDTPAGGQISVLGIRFTPPNNALTSIPVMTNVGTSGGSIAHFASGGDGWQTTFVLVNAGNSAAQATLRFFADNGSPLSFPLSFPQSGSGTTTVASSVTQTLAAGATLTAQSTASVELLTGSAQLSTTGNVSGFVIFRHNGQEAAVPLESRTADAYILAFDNTHGTATGVALNSVQAANIPVVVRDDTGALIATDTIPLAANGHYAFTLVTDKYPVTANIRGTIEFGTPFGGQIGVLAIRIPVAHTFTSLPALAK